MQVRVTRVILYIVVDFYFCNVFLLLYSQKVLLKLFKIIYKLIALYITQSKIIYSLTGVIRRKISKLVTYSIKKKQP